MQISISHAYRATPDQVVKMMGDATYLAQVAKEAGAASCDIQVHGNESVVHSRVPAPSELSRFVGQELQVDLKISWPPVPAGDGTRHGRLSVNTVGLPATISGTAELRPGTVAGEPGTLVDYHATLTVKIPLLGAKLEKSAEPYLRRAIDLQQSVGNRYLAGEL